jgi:uncharacterized membrane protein
MLPLILGMAVFMAVHLLPTFVELRQRLIGWKGRTVYTIGYSCAAMVGLLMIIFGKSQAVLVPVWDAPDWAYQLVPILMLVALILLPAAYMPTNLKRLIRHPFLTGVALWALSHLLVNGDLASIILFGGFGAFALFDMWSSNRRGAEKSTTKVPIYRDVALLFVGVVAFSIILHLHPYLFGVSAIP